MSERDNGSSNTVPKFASFKSRISEQEEPKHREASVGTPKFPSSKRAAFASANGDQVQSSRSHKSHEYDRKDGHGSRRHRRREPNDGTSRAKAVESVVEQKGRPRSFQTERDELIQSAASTIFFTDRKGDYLITKYGGLDRSHVVPYYRYGSGKVLGAAGRLIIDRDNARDRFTLVMPGQGQGQWTSGGKNGLHAKTLWGSKPSIFVRAKVNVTANLDDDGFIPLSSSNRSKRKHNELNSISEGDKEQPTYRSIEGKAKHDRHPESAEGSSDEQSELDPDSNNTGHGDPLKWRSMQLNRHLQQHPKDIGSWLELVDHQDDLLRAGHTIEDNQLSSNATHSFAEIKLNMLESALANSGELDDRTRVLVKLMHEGVKVWSFKKASKRWDEAMPAEYDCFDLWKSHLDFLLSNPTSFSDGQVRSWMLARIQQAVSRGSAESEGIPKFEEAIYIFARATRYFYDTGYTELAIAMWQGLIELNLFAPQTHGKRQRWGDFEAFWEDEYPRFGEEGAQGFSSYLGADRLEVLVSSQSLPLSVPQPNLSDRYAIWNNCERARANASTMPIRTEDEDETGDPYRIIVISDIQKWLFQIPDDLIDRVKTQLVDAFLSFCGLPCALSEPSWIDTIISDSSLSPPAQGTRTRRKSQNTVNNAPEVARALPDFDRAAPLVTVTSDLLASDKSWLGCFLTASSTETTSPAFKKWITGSLRHLVLVGKMEALATYYLGWCFVAEGSSLKSQAMAVLRQFPANAGLYGLYAKMVFSKGRLDTSEKVLDQMAQLFESPPTMQSVVRWKAWAEIQHAQGHLAGAAETLCKFVDANNDGKLPNTRGIGKASSTLVLKAQEEYRSRFRKLLVTSDPNNAAVQAECMCLLAYLSGQGHTEPRSATQGDVTASMAEVTFISAAFDTQRLAHHRAHERVLQYGTKLLYDYASRGPFRRAFLADRLATFIDKFPRNTIFLTLHEWCGSRAQVIDETTKLLDNKVLIPSLDCISSRIFAINHEIEHGNVYTAQGAFERALSSEVGRLNASLWIWYIRFCHAQKELAGKATDVYFRALNHCPRSKVLLLEAFGTLRVLMKPEDLEAVYAMMSKQGLRIHVELDSIVADGGKTSLPSNVSATTR